MLLKALETLTFRRLLDMGCGRGEFITELAGFPSQSYFIGIDIDEHVVREACARGRDRHLDVVTGFVCGDCLRIPLAPSSADVVVFRGLLHHVGETGVALAEAWRVLCEGGHLLVQDGKRMAIPLFEEMNEALSRSGLPKEVHPGFDTEVLAGELSMRGFMVEGIVDAGVATFATPPYTPKVYSTGLFLISARKAGNRA